MPFTLLRKSSLRINFLSGAGRINAGGWHEERALTQLGNIRSSSRSHRAKVAGTGDDARSVKKPCQQLNLPLFLLEMKS